MVDLAYAFDDPPNVDAPSRRAILGGKGAGLVIMTAAGIPVPPGFTITTEACRRYLVSGWDDELDVTVRSGLRRLEATTGKRLGDHSSPLLVSVRSGAEVSMPGMMDTVLDLGMSAEVERALAVATGDAAFAADTRRRAAVSFAEVVLGAGRNVLDALLPTSDPAAAETALVQAGFPIPSDPDEQVIAAVRAVFDSWMSARAQTYRDVEGIDAALGTAATVQAMVFGNLGERSGTGVAFTRDPSSGARGLMGDFLPQAQGEDVVAGGHETLPLDHMREAWPDQYAELERIAETIERDLADMADLEFTVEDGRLWLLQARRGKRSPIAAFRCAIDMADDPDFPLDRAAAVERCRPYFVRPPLVIDDSTPDPLTTAPIAVGLAASPGRASGVLCVDPDDAVVRAAEGAPVILARCETSPSDIHGMSVAAGLFTLRGGLVSHAAVVARDWGLPAVVGATDAQITDAGLEGPGGFVPVGAVVTVDGDRGTLTAGAVESTGRPAPEVVTVRRWADELASGGARSDGPSPASDGVAAPIDDQASFELLHGLRIKGMASAGALMARVVWSGERVDRGLRQLENDGLATCAPGRDLWRLTDAGRDAHLQALDRATRSVDVGGLPYEEFLGLNGAFKQLCTDWQLRDGAPNDHTDAVYDRGVVDRLVALDDRSQQVLARITPVLAWTGPYPVRLTAARCRLEASDPKALTGVMCESYHDVWMELHEDLILTLGIDRAAEGST